MELAEALNKVTEEAIKEQEAKQAEAGGGMEPGMEGNTPDAANAEATIAAMAGGQPSVQPPNQSQQNLGSLLSTLRRGA